MLLEPGFYQRDFAAYREIEAVNQSALLPIAISPLHYRAGLVAERKVSKPMRLGDVAHCAVLEADQLGKRYAVWLREDGKKAVFAGKDFEAFKSEAEQHGKRVIKQDELDTAMAVAASIRRNALAQRYLRRGSPEASMVWRDKETGLLCKGRLDWLSESVADVGVELKTSGSVSPRVFQQRFAQAQYDVQAAFYADGYEALTSRTLHMKCVAVESGPPHDVVVYDLAEAIDTGRVIYRELLNKLAECQRTNQWPGQCDTEQTLQLPRWRDPWDDESADDELDWTRSEQT